MLNGFSVYGLICDNAKKPVPSSNREPLKSKGRPEERPRTLSPKLHGGVGSRIRPLHPHHLVDILQQLAQIMTRNYCRKRDQDSTDPRTNILTSGQLSLFGD